MKTDQHLLIMRHASSEAFYLTSNDFDRSLDKKGQEQTLEIADQLMNRAIPIHHALVSPAKRTMMTWELLSQNLDQAIELHVDRRLYNALMPTLLDLLIDHCQDGKNLLLIAHNPAVTQVTQWLTGGCHDFNTADLAILSPKFGLADSLKQAQQFKVEKILKSCS